MTKHRELNAHELQALQKWSAAGYVDQGCLIHVSKASAIALDVPPAIADRLRQLKFLGRADPAWLDDGPNMSLQITAAGEAYLLSVTSKG